MKAPGPLQRYTFDLTSLFMEILYSLSVRTKELMSIQICQAPLEQAALCKTQE